MPVPWPASESPVHDEDRWRQSRGSFHCAYAGVVERDLPVWMVLEHPEQFEHVSVIGRELIRSSVTANDHILPHGAPKAVVVSLTASLA